MLLKALLRPRFAAALAVCAMGSLVVCALRVAHADGEATAVAEDEPVVDAASLVQSALLSGPGFGVDPHVELRGYMAHFTLDTPVGPLKADSVEVLAEREAELPAIDALERVTRSDAFAHAASDKFVATGKALGKIVMHPIDTIVGIPAGVARYFGDRLKKIGTQAQTASDRVARTLGTSGNPYPSDDGPMTDARNGDDGDEKKQKPTKHWYTRVESETEREIKRQLKYSDVKRSLAKQLGIDPYSGNPYVQDRLSSLAWVGTGGNFSATAALGTIGGTGAVVLSDTSRINDVVWKLSPDDLRARNGNRLHAYCRDELLIRQFLRRGVFSPTLQTGLVDALDQLLPADGADALLELGMTAHSELESRFLVNALRITAKYLGARAKGGTLRPIGAGLAYMAADGELIMPLPVDYLSWTAEVREFFDRREFRVTNKTVLIGGGASLLARRALTERGWNIVVRAPWPGAPAYAAFDEPMSDEEPQ
ncbi:MAG TPA: hypothetical protein VGO25_11655 [Rhodanobacteraceae bacterium]|nr:hypothetical protein [Rhodanobacteraceae bacterium]